MIEDDYAYNEFPDILSEMRLSSKKLISWPRYCCRTNSYEYFFDKMVATHHIRIRNYYDYSK